jgi:hypothetical protein
MSSRLLRSLLLLAAGGLAVAACGSGSDETSSTDPPTDSPPIEPPSTEPPSTTALDRTALDRTVRADDDDRHPRPDPARPAAGHGAGLER